MTSISGNETLVELREHLTGRVDTDIALSRSALSQFVGRYLKNELTDVELQEIGDLLEMTVDYEEESEGVIAQVLFEISSPEANGGINRERASEWRTMLLPSTP